MKKSYKFCNIYPSSYSTLNKKTQIVHEPFVSDSMKIKYKKLDHANPGNPTVWGPAMWFSLHNGASHYPKSASPFWKNR